jgi:isopenicillin N synthase-like dioxygenase
MAPHDKHLLTEIPSVDLNNFINKEANQRHVFTKELGEAFSTIGFVAVKNHYLTDELTTELYDVFENFFNLPDEIKQCYAHPELAGQRGYVGKRQENAKGSDQADLKEFYHIGQILSTEKLLSYKYPDNVWPKEVTQLKNICEKVYKVLEETAVELLRAIALFLDLDEFYFDAKVIEGNSILRAIHYFPLHIDDVEEGAVRAGAHGDINLITLLMGASAEGLEVQRRDGKWIAITALPDQIICNVGDMLERLTNNVLKSTIHRVVNPPKDKLNQSRYSMPFFMHPKSTVSLNCLDTCISLENPKQYTDTTAGEFLTQRLIEIGLIKG